MAVPSKDIREPVYGPGIRALVVDDEPELRRVLQSRLEWMGIEVIGAPTGDRAKELIEEGAQFDVVLSDIRMPGELNGYALAQYLNETRPHLPVILCTGYADELARSHEGLAVRTLHKPFTASELTDALTRALGLEPR